MADYRILMKVMVVVLVLISIVEMWDWTRLMASRQEGPPTVADGGGESEDSEVDQREEGLEDGEVDEEALGAELEGKNKAYDVLISWPPLPHRAKYVEGATLVPIQTRETATIYQRERLMFVFDYDPVIGGKALSLSKHLPENRLQEMNSELEKAWATLSVPLALDDFLANVRCEKLVGSRVIYGQVHWFLLLPSDVKSKIEQSETDLLLETKSFDNLILVTSTNVADLLKLLLAVQQQLPENIIPRLIYGHMAWGQSQMENEVTFGMFWPCEKIDDVLLRMKSAQGVLFDYVANTPAGPLVNGDYNINLCRMGIENARK